MIDRNYQNLHGNSNFFDLNINLIFTIDIGWLKSDIGRNKDCCQVLFNKWQSTTLESGSILNNSKRNQMTIIHCSLILLLMNSSLKMSWVDRPPKLEPDQISRFIILYSLASSSSTRNWWHCKQKVNSYPNKCTFLILVNLILLWNRIIYWPIKCRIKWKRINEME